MQVSTRNCCYNVTLDWRQTLEEVIVKVLEIQGLYQDKDIRQDVADVLERSGRKRALEDEFQSPKDRDVKAKWPRSKDSAI